MAKVKLLAARVLLGLLSLAVLFGVANSLRETRPEVSVYHQTIAPVVLLKSVNGGSSGSGVILTTGRVSLIVTNHHVVEHGPMNVHHQGNIYPSVVLKVDKEKDLALLVVHATLTPVAHVHPIEELKVYDEVLLVGAGRGLAPYPTFGIVSLLDYKGMYQASAGVVGGMSGGAVWRKHNGHYELVGIIRAMGMQGSFTPFGMMGTPVNNIAYIIKVDTLFKFLEPRHAQR